jgi:hypothetical protein
MQQFTYLCQFDSVPESGKKLRDAKGTYLWVYDSSKPRIMYVGTAIGKGGLFKRLREELEQIKVGMHYVIKIKPEVQDPYDILTNEPELSKTQLYELYYKRRNQLWIPGKENKSFFDEEFNEDWSNYVLNDYIKKIKIYYTEIQEEKAKILEAQLQIFIKEKFGIGYYTRGRGIKKSQSWIGMPEISKENLLNCLINIDEEFFIKKFNNNQLDFSDFNKFWRNN